MTGIVNRRTTANDHTHFQICACQTAFSVLFRAPFPCDNLHHVLYIEPGLTSSRLSSRRRTEAQPMWCRREKKQMAGKQEVHSGSAPSPQPPKMIRSPVVTARYRQGRQNLAPRCTGAHPDLRFDDSRPLNLNDVIPNHQFYTKKADDQGGEEGKRRTS